MSGNVFLKPAESYQRAINPIGQYVEQSSFYLSKMTGKPLQECKEFVTAGIRQKKFPGVVDPKVHYFERDEHFDRSDQETSLSSYISSVVKNSEILAPTFTTYIPPSVKKSLLVGFIDNNVKVRSKAKKEAFVAKAAGDINLYIMKNNEQDNRKRYNNSLSGAFAAGGSVVNNPTGHSTLTTITRTMGSLSNASNEKIIAGNRHYFSPSVTLNNVISITSSLNYDEMAQVLQKYQLSLPSVEQTLECIKYSSDFYWKDPNQFKKIEDFVFKLDPIERAGFVYCGDLYHLRKHNEGFVREFLTKLSRKVTGKVYENPTALIHKIDEQVVNYGHQICLAEVKGIGKDYSKLSPENMCTLLATCENVVQTIEEHRDLINALFLTKNIPASTAHIPHMVRRTVVLSDTDSTMFSVDEWVQWYFGELTFKDEAFALAGSIMFIATQCIAHSLAIFSANMNVEREKLFLAAMKPEFVFPVLVLTSVAKHYFASILVKEGNVYKSRDIEIKGVHLKNSAAPPSINKAVKAKIEEILDTIASGKKIQLVPELKRIGDLERHIKNSLLNGQVEFYKSSKIKNAEAYALGPEQSPYQYHTFWETVFGPKYGVPEKPPYGVIKIPTTINNRTALASWLAAMADREMAERLGKWLEVKNKKALPTMYVSSQYVAAFGIPEEIKSVIDTKRIVLDLTKSDRMLLEALGYFPKSDWLLSEQGY